MRLIILSRGRHDYSPTMEYLPKVLRGIVEVYVPKPEYSAYKASPIFSGVRIRCWPSSVDCIPKKRRYLYEQVDGEYIAIDDDLKLMVWDKEKKNYSSAESNPKGFVKGLELTYSDLEKHQNVGIANTFMTSMKVNDTGSFEFKDVPFCFAGFSKDRPEIDFKTFFFTDIAMPMQILKKGGSVVTKAHIAYSMRANKKLATTGTTPYRSDEVIIYSALSLAQQMPGHVTGLKNTGNNGGGWSLKKSFHRCNVNSSNEWLKEFSKEHGLLALPPLVDLDFAVPMSELFKTYARNMEKARSGKGNQVGIKERSLYDR